jgi:hypothetical protein
MVIFGLAGAGTVVNAWSNIGTAVGTIVTSGGNVLGMAAVDISFNGAVSLNNFRVMGTSAAGTFFIPNSNGFYQSFTEINSHKQATIIGYITGVTASTYVVTLQGSASNASGSMITDGANYGINVTLLELKK